MNRTIGVLLFIFFCYLIWLYLAIYDFSIDNWWTVNEIKQSTDDTVQLGVSLIKVLVGTVIFTLIGFIIHLLIRKKS
jgi:ABC-type Fe3+ transport system permease subunit